ncbi:hypothetical protein Cs7R123_48170 [Catellatospora sp. TT07R-123]|uniref:hypothetical protein n=1 Tax=Catellatospora sp. TT07R-123 TaxID=2733863 RepID=UPI001B2A3E40|nr:hypothetical protein [Catellatospora sp. TT07R-123]GHJ47475.1 hypothetical protein Cs7R123_48170 [Catellatospora sp. TT07R-123]
MNADEAAAAVEELARLVGWTGPAPDPVDQALLEAACGYGFPPDLMAFFHRFPPGRIGIVDVLHPLGFYLEHPAWTTAYPGYVAHVVMFEQALNRGAEEVDLPYRFGTGPGELLLWGLVEGDQALCWLVTADAPHTWQVVVCETGHGSPMSCQHYSGGAVRLLIDLGSGAKPVPMLEYVSEVYPYAFYS